ncbi:MAG: ferredoxin family protein [Armatimonadota bacterium]|nr:ferredoxin family protein [Armatimonadota bacterium]
MKKYLGVDRDKISWFPTIDAEKCTGCGACAEFCPNNVFELVDGVMTVANPLNCVPGCDKCAAECPVSAIKFPTKEELLEEIERLRNAEKLNKPEA